MNKLILYTGLLIAVPPFGLFQLVTDKRMTNAEKIIACSIGLPLGLVLYAVVYLLVRGFFFPG